MSYLAISRKYRPAAFDGIVGQEHVTRTLRNALERDRIHHAFLFTGARGVGKTTAARALARALSCENGPTAEPCGTCLACTEITGGMSPDLIEIDGASNNSVDDIRELRETVRYAPTRGKWKIYLVDEVHMLSKGAFNALLKTLEEPPPHVVFIFATTEPNRIPDTILSRVQRFDFKRIPVVQIAERLEHIAKAEGATLSERAIRMIARAGEGSMRDAESLLDQVLSFSGAEVTDEDVVDTLGLIDRALLHETLQGLVEGRPERCLDAIDRVYEYGYELSEFTSELLEVLRNATFLRLSDEVRKHLDLADDEVAQLERIVEGVDPDALARTFTAMLDVHDQVSKASRPRIVLEMAIARLATVRPVQPVGALLGRLEDLERRLRQGGPSAASGGLRRSHVPASQGRPPAAPRAASPRRTRVPAPTKDDDDREPAPAPAEEPPPWDPGVVEEAPVPRTSPWAAFRGALGGVAEADALTSGEAVHQGQVLRVVVATTRQQALASRAARLPQVASALARCYPEGTTLEIVTREATTTADDREAVLKRALLEDPAVRRIVETLGADLQKVIPTDDGE